MNTTTQQRLNAIYSTMDRLGFPVEAKQGVWLQLHGLTPAGRANVLTRWESAAESWPTEPLDAAARRALAGAAYVL